MQYEMNVKEFLLVCVASISVAIFGSFISYPAYAKLAGLTVFISSVVLLVLRSDEIEQKSKKGLKRNSRKRPEAFSKTLVKGKTKSKK